VFLDDGETGPETAAAKRAAAGPCATSMMTHSTTMDTTESSEAGAQRAGGVEDEPPQPSGLRPGPSSPPDTAASRLVIADATGEVSARALAWLEQHGTLVIEHALGAGCGRWSVALSVVDDTTMAGLHERHSGVSGTTDVLTFDLSDDPSGEGDVSDGGGDVALEAEVVVCLDEARRRAGSRTGAVERELLLYLLHGALHCLGYDDRDGAGFARMHAREDEILRAIGVGAVFSDGGAGDAGGGDR